MPALERGHERVDAGDLRVHVAPPLRHSRLGFLAPLVVRRVRQVAMLTRVDDRNQQLVGKRHRAIFERRAVEQKHVTALTKGRRELVHDPDLHARRLLLGSLARQRRLGSVHSRRQAGGDGNQQGC